MRVNRCDVRDFATCTGCGACRAACSHAAIRMEADGEGFAYPRIDGARCSRCGACRAACPVDRAAARPWLNAVAARCRDEEIRRASSSGGVFTALAEEVLADGGMVFGAAFDKGFALRHTAVEQTDALHPLRGSKYLQSDLGETFVQAKTALKCGRRVLFSGTPCQTAGLLSVLRAPCDNLLTVDLVCHGAPSPMVFAAYLRALEAKRGQPVRTLSFRDKRRGWKDFCLAATFADGSEYAAGQTEDPYMIAFLRNLCLRPSCHCCPFAGEKRQADLTLADLWGAQRLMPGQDDDQGLSLVLVNSEKGERTLERVRERLWTEPVDAAACARDNPSIFGASRAHPRRAAFLRHVRRRGFDGVEKFFAPPGLLRRLTSKALRVPRGVARRALRMIGTRE